MPDIFVDPVSGSDVNNNGTDVRFPLRSLNASANSLALNVQQRNFTAGYSVQTIYLNASGAYSGVENCHVVMSPAMAAYIKLRIVGFDANQNLTKATFSCGQITFLSTEPFVHLFQGFLQLSLRNVAYVNNSIDANSIFVVNQQHNSSCVTTLFLPHFGSCPVCMLCISAVSTGPFRDPAIVLDGVDILSNSINRSALTTDQWFAPSNVHLVAMYGPAFPADIASIVVQSVRAVNNSVTVSPCMPTNFSNSTMNRWAVVSGAVLGLNGLVNIDQSLIADNTLTVVEYGEDSNSSILCVWAGGAGLYLLEAIPVNSTTALVTRSEISRNQIVSTPVGGRVAGAGVLVAADFLKSRIAVEVPLAAHSLMDGNSIVPSLISIGAAVASGFRRAVMDNQTNMPPGVTSPMPHRVSLNHTSVINNFMQGVLLSGGAGVYASAKLRLFNCTFTNNTAISRHSAGGAAVSVDFNMLNSSFTGNFALQRLLKTGATQVGGAVSTSFALDNLAIVDFGSCPQNLLAKPSFTGCNFTRNSAAANGGALFLSGQCVANVFVQNCTFIGNSADMGAAYYAVGASSLAMSDSSLVGNIAKVAGTVFLAEPIVSKFLNCVFDNNDAPVGAALMINSANTVSLRSTNVTNNRGSRGAVVRLADIARTTYVVECVFAHNVAFVSIGGALSLENTYGLGNGSIYNSIFVNNSGSLGGGAFLSMGAGVALVTISGSRFEGNFGDTGAGLAIVASDVIVSNVSFVENNATGDGGALSIDKSSGVVVSDTTFRFNIAGAGGGSISAGGMSGVRAKNCTFDTNKAQRGGSVATKEHVSATFTDCTFFGDVASSGASLFGMSGSLLFVDSCTSHYGFVSGASVASASLSSEATIDFGGAFMSLEDANGVVLNATVEETWMVGGVGGAFRCVACTLSLTNVAVRNCRSTVSRGGGALYVLADNTTSVYLTNLTISGATVSSTASLVFEDQQMWRIDGFSSGGALLFEFRGNLSGKAPILSLRNVTMTHNSADQGGAFYVDAPLLDFSSTDTVLTLNNATLVGGGTFTSFNTSLPRSFLANVTSNSALCFGKDLGSVPSVLAPTRALPSVIMRGVEMSLSLQARDEFGDAVVCAARGGARNVLISNIANSTCVLSTVNLCTVADSDAMCVGSVSVDAPINTTCGLRIDLHSSDVLSAVIASIEFNVTIVQCGPGFGVDERGLCHECPTGTFNLVAGGSCDACPSSAVCHGANVSAAAGFFLYESADGRVVGYACEPGACAEAPLGELNKCVANRTGLLCASCINSTDDHYVAPTSLRRDGSMCVACNSATGWLLALFALAGVAIVLYLHHSVQGSSSRLKILFYFTQSANQVLPRAAVNEFFGALSLRANRGSPVVFDLCLLPLRPLSMQLLQLAVPAAMVVTLLLIFAAQRLWLLVRGPALVENDRENGNGAGGGDARGGGNNEIIDAAEAGGDDSIPSSLPSGSGLNNVGLAVRSSGELPAAVRPSQSPSSSRFQSTVLVPGIVSMGDSSFFSTDRLVRTLIFFALLSYTTMLQTTLSVLWCMNVGGESVMVIEPSEKCTGESYQRAHDVVLFALLPIVIAMPIALAVLLAVWNRRNRLIVSRSAERVADIDVRYGVLYENYRHRSYLWEAVNLLRRLAMALFTIFLSGTPLHSLAMTLLCFAVLALTWTVRPFVNNVENVLEIFSLSMLVVFGIVAQAVDVHALGDAFLPYFGTFALVVACCLALSVVARPRLWLQLRVVVDKVRGKPLREKINR